MVLLRMPSWASDVVDEDQEVDSWADLARAQLRRQGADWWEQYEEGDVLAVEDRESFSQAWPGNKRFVLFVDEERLALFSEEGLPVHVPEDTPQGLISMAAWEVEFASNKGEYYRIPPSSSCENAAILPDFSAAYTTELDAAKIDTNIGWLQPRDDEDQGDAVCCIRLHTVPPLATLASSHDPLRLWAALRIASEASKRQAQAQRLRCRRKAVIEFASFARR